MKIRLPKGILRVPQFHLPVVDRFDFEDFIRPVGQLDFEWIHDRHATTAREIKLLAACSSSATSFVDGVLVMPTVWQKLRIAAAG